MSESSGTRPSRPPHCAHRCGRLHDVAGPPGLPSGLSGPSRDGHQTQRRHETGAGQHCHGRLLVRIQLDTTRMRTEDDGDHTVAALSRARHAASAIDDHKSTSSLPTACRDGANARRGVRQNRCRAKSGCATDLCVVAGEPVAGGLIGSAGTCVGISGRDRSWSASSAGATRTGCLAPGFGGAGGITGNPRAKPGVAPAPITRHPGPHLHARRAPKSRQHKRCNDHGFSGLSRAKP